MGNKINRPASESYSTHEFRVEDDFPYYTDADLWTKAEVGTGTVGHQGPGRSNIQLFSTADNDAGVLATTNELFKFVANKNIVGRALNVNITRPGTNNDGFAFGFADAMAATLVADDGAGIVIVNEGATLDFIESETVWNLTTEMDGTQTRTASTTSVSGTQDLELLVTWMSSTEFQVRGKVDGVLLRDSNNIEICHTITLGTATDMDFGAVYKGHHADDGTCLIDHLYAAQVR